MLMVDGRWRGAHGIGRFASEVLARIPFDAEVKNIPLLGALEAVQLALYLQQHKPSLYFSPGFNPPLWASCPVVFTLHDLIHLEVPEEASLSKKIYYRTVVKPALRQAKKVLTVSEFSKQRIAAWSGIKPEKITVVGNGVDPQYHPEGEQMKLGFEYLLYVGNHKAHKNIPRLLEAFATLKNDVKLVFSGNSQAETQTHIIKLGLENQVVWAGFIPEADLPKYYRGAKALVLPSLYEGFGLTPLEAMACGTPVAVANCTSIPEVVGDAGCYFDPLDVRSMSRALGEVLDNASLRTELTTRGLNRAKQFSWDSVAQKVAAELR